MAVAPQILVPTAINNERFKEILNLLLSDFNKNIVIMIHGITTIKALNPYKTKSIKLILIPNNIIPSFKNLLIQKSYPGFNLETNEIFKFENIIPTIIAIIIGDIGLFSNPSKILPILFDSSVEKKAVTQHNNIPRTSFLLNVIESLYLLYYT